MGTLLTGVRGVEAGRGDWKTLDSQQNFDYIENKQSLWYLLKVHKKVAHLLWVGGIGDVAKDRALRSGVLASPLKAVEGQ